MYKKNSINSWKRKKEEFLDNTCSTVHGGRRGPPGPGQQGLAVAFSILARWCMKGV